MTAMLTVEVAYALPEKQKIVVLKVVEGTSAQQAAEQSGIVNHFDGLDLSQSRMGIFGKAIGDPSSYVLSDGDRVEIYRPLKADPKEARKQRAKKAVQTD